MNKKKKNSINYNMFKVNYIEKYFSASSLLNSDDLTIVVRSHLLIEMLIEMSISSSLDRDDILYEKNFTFYTKLILGYSLNLFSEEIFLAIKRINKIRNKFAHNIDTKLQDLDIEVILGCFKKDGGDRTLHKYKNDKKILFGLSIYYLLGYLSGPAFQKQKLD